MHTDEPFSARNIAAWPAELPPPTTTAARRRTARLELGGGVEDAGHLVAVEAVDGKPAVVGAGGATSARPAISVPSDELATRWPATSSSDLAVHGLVMSSPNFWAWIEARFARSWPEMPVGNPR